VFRVPGCNTKEQVVHSIVGTKALATQSTTCARFHWPAAAVVTAVDVLFTTKYAQAKSESVYGCEQNKTGMFNTRRRKFRRASLGVSAALSE
jgi:hypothetical protein